MAAKKHDQEPSVSAVIQACPSATKNPKTKRPFCDKTIQSVFTTECFDFDPEHPWRFQNALQKVFLPVLVKEHRLAMAKHILR